SSAIALHDFTSAGTPRGGIATAAPELTRKPIIARARIFAMMRLSSSSKLAVSQGKASAALQLRPIEKLRYFGCCVKLPSNDPYGGSPRLLGSEPVPSNDRVSQRREIG